jgi:hypothetical protein
LESIKQAHGLRPRREHERADVQLLLFRNKSRMAAAHSAALRDQVRRPEMIPPILRHIF